MEHQTLRNEPDHGKEEDFLKAYYNSLASRDATPAVRLAPLAEFDKDFDSPFESRHKVQLFKALYMFFTVVILLIGFGSAALGVYYILDEERVQLHQIILVNVRDISDIDSSEAQPVLYYVSLALVGSGILMAFWSLFNFLSTSKEQVFLIAMVRKEKKIR